MEQDRAKLPEWLDDAREMERIGPLPSLEPCNDLPEWIQDLQYWLAWDWHGTRIPWDPALGNPPVQEDVSQEVEESHQPAIADSISSSAEPVGKKITGEAINGKKPAQATTPAPETPPQKVTPPAPALPIAAPAQPAPVTGDNTLARPLPASPATVVLPKTTELVAKPTQLAGQTVLGNKRPVPPVEPPAPTQVPKSRESQLKKTRMGPAAPRLTQLIAEQTIKQAGYDPRTGQVVDNSRFESWKHSKARAGAVEKITNAGLMEVFRKARTAVENWVDRPTSRDLVLRMDLIAIRSNPEIEAILQEYQNYGEAFRANLLRHLEFMTENRSKYYKARPEG